MLPFSGRLTTSSLKLSLKNLKNKKPSAIETAPRLYIIARSMPISLVLHRICVLKVRIFAIEDQILDIWPDHPGLAHVVERADWLLVDDDLLSLQQGRLALLLIHGQ